MSDDDIGDYLHCIDLINLENQKKDIISKSADLKTLESLENLIKKRRSVINFPMKNNNSDILKNG